MTEDTMTVADVLHKGGGGRAPGGSLTRRASWSHIGLGRSPRNRSVFPERRRLAARSRPRPELGPPEHQERGWVSERRLLKGETAPLPHVRDRRRRAKDSPGEFEGVSVKFDR